MEELNILSKLVIQIAGPLMLACIIIMYASVALRTRQAPRPSQALYLYVKYNMENRSHAGIMTYALIACTFFFFAALTAMLVLRVAG